MNVVCRMDGGRSGKEISSKRRPSIFLDSELQEDDSDALPVLIPAQQHLPEVLSHSCVISDNVT